MDELLAVRRIADCAGRHHVHVLGAQSVCPAEMGEDGDRLQAPGDRLLAQAAGGTQAGADADVLEYLIRSPPPARSLSVAEDDHAPRVRAEVDNRDLAGVQRHLRAGGRQLLIADADGDPSLEVGLALELYDRRVDALIVSPIAPFAEGWAEVAERVPTVSVGERMPGAATAGQVLFDNERAVRAVLEHLAERGHRRVGVLSWAIERAPARSAEQAVVEWSERLGLEMWPARHDSLTQMSAWDLRMYLPEDILAKVDRASMAVALEVRAPWLDHRIIEFALRIVPPDLKVKKADTRILQRLLARKLLPAELDLNRKQGFVMPTHQWLVGAWERPALELLNSEAMKEWFDVGFIHEMMAGLRKGYTNGVRLFTLLMLALWLQGRSRS